MANIPTIPLRTGADPISIPQLGFGVWEVPQDEVTDAVLAAFETGYRSIDTAMIYQNEEGVGRAIAKSGLKRDEIFVTTKVWNTDQGRDKTPAALDASLNRLGLDHVDLYLMHWPTPERDLYVETWKALLDLRQTGKTRAVGVCNFKQAHLDRLAQEGLELPAVNQIELHPYLTQEPMRRYNAEHDIVTEDWSPLGARAKVFDDPAVGEIARAHGKTPAQVILRWHVQIGSVVIPRSVKPQRVKENFEIFDFELSDAEMATLSGLNQDKRTGPDPDTMNMA